MHSAAGLPCHWLGQKGGGASFLSGGIFDNVLRDHGVVCHLGHLSQFHLNLHLAAAAHFRVMVFDFHTPLLH